ncbi:MAG: carboxypeptidase-like regulatory domain-containing protein [Longimicrobiales bacterium]
MNRIRDRSLAEGENRGRVRPLPRSDAGGHAASHPGSGTSTSLDSRPTSPSLPRSLLGPGRILFPLLIGLLVPPSPLPAQAVAGRLSDAETQEPVQGALVLLLEDNAEVRGGFLTNEDGRFLIPAPGAGRYSLKMERIGYRTVTTPPFLLEDGETREISMVMVQAPVELEGLSVEGRSRCVVRPEESQKVAQAWEEARKALANQEWASQGGFLRFQVVRYRRELNLEGKVVEEGKRETATFMGRTPIRSLPPEDLSTLGYVRQRESGAYDYFGPDARVLLSEHFQATHCFRLVEDEERPEMVGLAFEPLGRRKVPDIRGTFWLLRRTATLVLLEYGYTRLPWSEAQGVAGGKVEFGVLLNGAWVIRRWSIRMPLMVLDHSVRRLGGDGLRVDGVMEEGEEVVKVTMLGGGRIVETVAARPGPQRPPPAPRDREG